MAYTSDDAYHRTCVDSSCEPVSGGAGTDVPARCVESDGRLMARPPVEHICRAAVTNGKTGMRYT